MSQEVDALAAQVAANTTVEQSAIVLIQGIAAQLADVAGDKQKALALSAQLNASAAALSAAITANTPAAPAPAPVDPATDGDGVTPPAFEQAARARATAATRTGAAIRRMEPGIMRRPPGLRDSRWPPTGGPLRG